MLSEIDADVRSFARTEQAVGLHRFFKTGPGQYGEGDIFVGIAVPQLRSLAKKYREIALEDLVALLRDPIHEKRLLALILMVNQSHKSSAEHRQKLYELYLASTRYINNWDLVDVSAEHIVGPFASIEVLSTLSQSKLLWERRIAMIACFHHIKSKRHETALHIASLLQYDEHDLMHKAVGWMLREVGKRCSQDVEEAWLRENGRYKNLPRTMLRYAIERFAEDTRKKYLGGLL